MARDGSTYRGARRNECIRGETKFVWGPDWYYSRHRNPCTGTLRDPDRVAAVYAPAQRYQRKKATTTNIVHQLLKRGDYAGAMRAVYGGKGERVRASGRGD